MGRLLVRQDWTCCFVALLDRYQRTITCGYVLRPCSWRIETNAIGALCAAFANVRPFEKLGIQYASQAGCFPPSDFPVSRMTPV